MSTKIPTVPEKMKLKMKMKSMTPRKMKVMKSFKGIKKLKLVAAKIKLRRSFKKSVKKNAKVDSDFGVGVPSSSRSMGIGSTNASPTNVGEAKAKRSIGSKWIKKILRPKFPRPRALTGNNSNAKNMIIIHNNTSVSSNDEFNRSSCVDIGKDAIVVKGDVGVVDRDREKEEKEEESKEESKVDIVDVTSVGSVSPPSPNQASKDEEEERTARVDIVELYDEGQNGNLPTEDATGFRKDKAIVLVQSAFRGHLARRAYRALKSLVKLQAVVRGVCVRRQARIALHCMNTLARLQVRVRERQLLIA